MRRFRIVAIGLLLWNLLGVMAWYTQSHADLAAMARTDPVTAQIWRAMPGWAWGAYALAVWAGTLGAVALLMQRRWAIVLFALSLAGVVAQFGWTFLGTDIIARKGPATAVFPAVIALIGIFQLWWAKRQPLR